VLGDARAGAINETSSTARARAAGEARAVERREAARRILGRAASVRTRFSDRREGGGVRCGLRAHGGRRRDPEVAGERAEQQGERTADAPHNDRHGCSIRIAA
jgi:hypothetical protein